MCSKSVTFTQTFMSQQQLCNVHLARKFTQNHAVKYPFMPSARHSHSTDSFSKLSVSLSIVYCVEACFHNSPKNSCTDCGQNAC